MLHLLCSVSAIKTDVGSWGTGSLENDVALDESHERSCALVAQLWARLQKRESWEADEWDYGALFVDFETLFALEAGGVFDSQPLTTLEDVDGVLTRWLAGWDGYYPSMAPQEGVLAARREVLQTTFARFREIATRYAQE